MDIVHMKTNKSIDPDLLIPAESELGQLLMQLAEDNDERTWKIANICNDLIEEVEGGEVTKTDIYKAVATRCKGREPNTIRRWAEVALDFDKDTQEQYAGLLSFNHFKVARRLFKDGHTPYLNYALEWCVEGNDDKLAAGRFHTVGQLLQHFLPADTFENQLVKHWEKGKEKFYDLIIIHDNDTQREKLLNLWIQMNYVIQDIQPLDKTEAV